MQVAGVIEDAQARVTGTVTDFTKDIADNYYMTINFVIMYLKKQKQK